MRLTFYNSKQYCYINLRFLKVIKASKISPSGLWLRSGTGFYDIFSQMHQFFLLRNILDRDTHHNSRKSDHLLRYSHNKIFSCCKQENQGHIFHCWCNNNNRRYCWSKYEVRHVVMPFLTRSSFSRTAAMVVSPSLRHTSR